MEFDYKIMNLQNTPTALYSGNGTQARVVICSDCKKCKRRLTQKNISKIQGTTVGSHMQ